jgi:two-component system, cell cycle sensor histidine kinase and response regulator CckA
VIRDDLAQQNGTDVPHDGGLHDLQELHARVMFMLEAARMGTWDANLTTDDVTWSEGLPAIFGLDASQFGGTITMDAFMELVHPDDREAIARQVSQIDNTELKFAVEFRRIWPDGSLHWLESKGYVVRDEAGRAIRAVGVTSDITERKRADSELAIYRDLVRHLSLGVYVYSLEDAANPRSLRLVTANPAASHFTHVPMQTIIGKTIGEAFPALLATDLPARYADVIRTGKSIDVGDLPYTDDRNAPSIFRVKACPVSVTSMAVLYEDVTEQRRLEAALDHTHKMEAIGLLAGGVAHDFNNLLTVIIGYSDGLVEALPDDDGLRLDAMEIKAAAERAADLTSQLLAFGRKQILQPRVVSLNALVAEADTLLRRVLGEHIHMSLVLDPELRSVVADPGQIGQVIVNLAVNARDAMSGGGRLTIETANVDLPAAARGMAHAASGRYVALSISDTGIGMDAATQAHVFEPFFTTKANQGTGLGLATVYGIIKQSGGYIWLYSEVGRGTSFRIYLPAIDAATSDPTAVALKPYVVSRGHETVLLVEDEPALNQLAARVLTSRGFDVMHAGHPHEALALMAQHGGDIQLLLTDIVMPEMDGRALAQRVQAAHPETRVLYMSGYSGSAIIHDGALEAGAAFLQKPFTPSALAQKVREVLDSAPVGSSVKASC